MTFKLPSSLASFAAGCLMALPMAAVHADDSLDKVLAKGSIAIGIAGDFPPYAFVGPDFKPQGLEIDLANYVADKLGVKPDLVTVTNPNRIPYLQTRRIDVIISTLGKNPEREQVIDFGSAYAPFFQAVYGPASMHIAAIGDLADKTAAVTRGTIQDDILTQTAPKSLRIQRFEDDASTVQAFVSGQTQLLVTGVSVADMVIKNNPQLKAEYKLLLKDSPNFIGVRKGETALKERLNAIILEAKENGTLEALSQKWLGRDTGELPL
ncbi:amino acid ABC transporter substrate-binding protein [Corticibacter populi]|uniref:Amino acid ABC transporter substrate-binding protein n=1 Tax=Corticibacter populi TaxID=1550736 RepID=A0A3M6R096_9BURK|nr:transporter substrate-binding domain-containing protein [Corticibacter populi]RMX08668.1 amino acid ABC transporter substrate-binding protein [Corticibacter populi]RZS36005.1 amino acid ABC transporter substrate-binding protein (PAAT family) [Corticibacter populi]